MATKMIFDTAEASPFVIPAFPFPGILVFRHSYFVYCVAKNYPWISSYNHNYKASIILNWQVCSTIGIYATVSLYLF